MAKIMRNVFAFVLALSVLASGSAVSGETVFTEDFSAYPAGNCLPDGTVFGPWTVVWAGFGCVKIESDGSDNWLHAVPKAPKGGNTHSSLIVGPHFSGPLTYEVSVLTVEQTRTKTKPRAWEVGWVVWNYTDSEHFYYFIAKPNGWELGKRDPAYSGGQRFLATGTQPKYLIGTEYSVKVSQDENNTITVWVDDVELVNFTDLERPYASGKIGLYTEDALVHFDDIVVSQ